MLKTTRPVQYKTSYRCSPVRVTRTQLHKSNTSSIRHARRTYATESSSGKKTALYNLHVELGGKMVNFAGWELPIQYKEGIVESHLHTRNKVSLFDVSHMAQLRISGKDRVKFLESLVVADLVNLPDGHATLSLFTNEKGGIIDDTIITNAGDHFYIVVNAGCADKDIPHITKHVVAANSKGMDVQFEQIHRSLIAVQGPLAEKTLSALVKEDITKMPFMTSKLMEVDGALCRVSRCGYTGEDGFEVSVANDSAVALTKKFLSLPDVKPAGLGARDSLRLEAGLCLYGHDINEDTTPVEAALTWCIGKRRKEEGGFPGSDTILRQLKEGVSKKRVGFIIEGPPARENATIHDKNDEKEVGVITSGTFSPNLKKAIAMGYIATPLSKLKTEVNVKVRGKYYPATVTKMPFVPSNYKRIQ